jgi:hypothetical protein
VLDLTGIEAAAEAFGPVKLNMIVSSSRLTRMFSNPYTESSSGSKF